MITINTIKDIYNDCGRGFKNPLFLLNDSNHIIFSINSLFDDNNIHIFN